MEDSKIIEMFLMRDEQALRVVERKYGGLCFSVASNFLHDRSDAEECVNDTYLAVWNSIPPACPIKLSAFITKIVRNKAVSRFRKNTTLKRGSTEYNILLSELNEDIASRDGTEELIDKRRVAEVISGYLREVTEEKAAVFVLRYYYWYPESEISRKTGFSCSKIASVLYRMRKELKKRLEKEEIFI